LQVLGENAGQFNRLLPLLIRY